MNIISKSMIVISAIMALSLPSIGGQSLKSDAAFELSNNDSFSPTSDIKMNAIEDTYTATFHSGGDVYTTIQYSKSNYLQKAVPLLPSSREGHYNYWYPNVDFSIFEDTTYDCMEGLAFKVKNGGLKYTTGAFESITDSNMSISQFYSIKDGTISMTLNKSAVAQDSGIVFGVTYINNEPDSFWETFGVSYYFFYFSQAGNAVLSKVTNGKYATLISKPTSIGDAIATLKVSIDENFIQCFINDSIYIKYTEDIMLSGTNVGFRLGKAGSRVSDYKVSYIPEEEAEDLPGFYLANGGASRAGKRITFDQDQTIIYSKNSPIYNREYSWLTIMNSGQKSGFIFGLELEDRLPFYEEGVNYFFYYVDNAGKVVLSHINDGVETVINDIYAISAFSTTTTYNLNLNFINNKVRCYLGNYLLYTYENTKSFAGTYYGFKATLKSSVITIW